MGKLRALALVGALAAVAPVVATASPAAAATCSASGAPIGGVFVSRGVGINVSATSGVWSCAEGPASVSLTVQPVNPLATLLVDNATGSAAATGSVAVNYTVPPTLFVVLLLPKGQCFRAIQTVTGPDGVIAAIHSAQGCG